MEKELLLNFGSQQVYLTHGHLHRVKHGLSLLASDALERGAQVAVFLSLIHISEPTRPY